MSVLLFLNSDDFSIQKGTKGDIMCHNIPGFSLILFYSTHCPHCQNLVPIFRKLPGSIGGCQFGMMNVSLNKACVNMSQNTVAPIKYVPYIMLYINGKPYMMYKGPANEENIKKFVVEIANNINKKQQFSKEHVKEDPETGGVIPAYCLGVPVSGTDLRCYLEFGKFNNMK